MIRPQQARFQTASLLIAAILTVAAIHVGFAAPPHMTKASKTDSASRIDFVRDVRPILAENCFTCHGLDAGRRQAGLRLDVSEGARAVLPSGRAAIVSGRPERSELVERVTTAGALVMPPASTGKHVTARQAEILRRWIAQGAPYVKHWAYVKPVRPKLPAVSLVDWPVSPLDRFVLARLEREGLQPSPEADRYTLIRRLSLDITGLPPSIPEVDAFVRDHSPNAYEKVVDRLFASPHYGERMARPWLDLARYADTNGYEKDLPRKIWPYRDWVIDAFNSNLPFDEFTIEQIAGDLLPNPTPWQIVATGFHRNTLLNDEGGADPEEFRVVAVMDRIDTTATTWLGTTLACAQCHTHKYDPFTQKEYYQFFALFNQSADNGHDPDPGLKAFTPEQQRQADALAADLAIERRTLEADTGEIAAARAAWEADALNEKETPPAIRQILSGPPADRTDDQERRLDAYFRANSPLLKPMRDRVADIEKQQKELIGSQPTTLVMREVKTPRPNRILVRGDFRNPGETVTPDVPSALNPMRPGDPRNRLGLARWLVDRDNPLTARVVVNRYWEMLFGRGIVVTAEDFGTQGEPPSNQELLDWLATEFMRLDWNVKALLKEIVMSATYRQSSRVSPMLQLRDPNNILLARGPRFRVEAEMVRDLALAVSGRLNPALGGPSVFPPQPSGIWENSFSFYDTKERWVDETGPNRYRRGIYTYWRRTAPYPMALTFDVNSRDVCSAKRSRTNSPLQALDTLNDPVFVEAAGGLAQRMLHESAPAWSARIAYGFRLCAARPPKPAELKLLTSLAGRALIRYRTDDRAASSLIAQCRLASDQASKSDLAAAIVVANVLLNMDETITNP